MREGTGRWLWLLLVCWAGVQVTIAGAGQLDNFIATQPSKYRAAPLDYAVQKMSQAFYLDDYERILPLSSYHGVVNYLYYSWWKRGVSADYSDTARFGHYPSLVAMAQDVAQFDRPLMATALWQHYKRDFTGEFYPQMVNFEHLLAGFANLIPAEGLLHRTWKQHPGESISRLIDNACVTASGNHQEIRLLCDQYSTIKQKWLVERNQYNPANARDRVCKEQLDVLLYWVRSSLMAEITGHGIIYDRDGAEPEHFEPWSPDLLQKENSLSISKAFYRDAKDQLIQPLLKSRGRYFFHDMPLEAANYPFPHHGLGQFDLQVTAISLESKLDEELIDTLTERLLLLKEGESLILELHANGKGRGRSFFVSKDLETGRVMLFRAVQMESEWWNDTRKNWYRWWGLTYPKYAYLRAARSTFGVEADSHPVIGITFKDLNSLTNQRKAVLQYLQKTKEGKDFYYGPVLLMKVTHPVSEGERNEWSPSGKDINHMGD